MKNILLFTIAIIGIHMNAQVPVWNWAYGGGGNLLDKGMALAVDGSDNVFVTGGYESATATFGSYSLNNALADSFDVCVVKYDASGTAQWARGAGGLRNDEATCVSTDMSGDVIVAGYFYSSSITFGTFTLNNTSGYSDMFIVKYNTSGTALWAYNFGGIYDDQVYAIETDNSGNIFITGYFLADSLIMGNDTLLCAGTYDMFVAKLDANGVPVWTRRAGTTGDERGTAITVAQNGDVIVGGTFNTSSLIIGNDTLMYVGGAYSDMFFAKYDNTGNVLWAFEEGGTYLDKPQDLGVDLNGNIYLAAMVYSSSITIGSDVLNNSGSSFYCDVVITQYDQNGTPQWADIYGVGTGNDIVYAIDVDPTGVSYITGIHGSGIDFGGNILNGIGLFVVRLESFGTVYWATHVEGASGTGIGLGIADGLFVCGIVYGPSATFGTYTVTNTGAGDLYIGHISQVLGTSTNSQQPEFSVYPNPSNGILFFDGLITSHEYSVTVINTLGEVVKQLKVTGDKPQINCSDLSRGMYLISVSGNSSGEQSNSIIVIE